MPDSSKCVYVLFSQIRDVQGFLTLSSYLLSSARKRIWVDKDYIISDTHLFHAYMVHMLHNSSPKIDTTPFSMRIRVSRAYTVSQAYTRISGVSKTVRFTYAGDTPIITTIYDALNNFI